MKRIQAKKHKIGTYEINKISKIKDMYQMMEFILWIIFIGVVMVKKRYNRGKKL